MGPFVTGPVWRLRIDLRLQQREKGVQVLAVVGPGATRFPESSYFTLQTLTHEDAGIAIILLFRSKVELKFQNILS